MPTDQVQQPSWGVVMPFYHNQATIDACLSSFLEQAFAPSEIIVIDDGSLSSEELHALAARWPAPVVIESRPHGGQAACTNHAIRRADSDFVLLTCADIIAPRYLLQLHRDAHARRPDDVAVLGPLPYARAVPMTPFMRYLSLPGVQFCFNDMTDPENVNPMHCYAPNISMSRAALLNVGLFDESFTYGLQDTDLGHRLGISGVRFVLEPKAYALHARGATLRSYLERQRRVGHAIVRWMEKYPNDTKMAEQLTGALRVAFLHKLPFDVLVEQAAQAYAPYDNLNKLPTQTYVELFTSFSRLFGAAAGMGVLEQHDRLQGLLQTCPALQGEHTPLI